MRSSHRLEYYAYLQYYRCGFTGPRLMSPVENQSGLIFSHGNGNELYRSYMGRDSTQHHYVVNIVISGMVTLCVDAQKKDDLQVKRVPK